MSGVPQKMQHRNQKDEKSIWRKQAKKINKDQKRKKKQHQIKKNKEKSKKSDLAFNPEGQYLFCHELKLNAILLNQ